jgi:nitrile hydratase subunit alpha
VSDGHSHDHEHDHDASAAISNRVKALVATLERKGLVSEAEIDATVTRFVTGAQPANGFRAVAHAWTDPGFKARLLTDATAAVGELGIDLSHWAPVKIRAVENTPELHNVIVCTLCSCYPLSPLGPSPTWYKSEAYRSRVVRDPRGVLREFGFELDPTTRISVWDASAESRYLVLPRRPDGTDGDDEEALAARVTRNGLIGVAAV